MIHLATTDAEYRKQNKDSITGEMEHQTALNRVNTVNGKK